MRNSSAAKLPCNAIRVLFRTSHYFRALHTWAIYMVVLQGGVVD